MRRTSERLVESLQVIDSCRKIGVEILAGARMNDCQGVRPLYPADNPDNGFFLLENPELAAVSLAIPTRFHKRPLRGWH